MALFPWQLGPLRNQSRCEGSMGTVQDATKLGVAVKFLNNIGQLSFLPSVTFPYHNNNSHNNKQDFEHEKQQVASARSLRQV